MTHASDKTEVLEAKHVRKRQSLEAILREADILIGKAPFRISTHWKRQQIRRQCWEAYPFKIAVIALAKSGKSTLINSWLGDEFLPMSSLPETAHILSIQQQSRLKSALLERNGKTCAKGVIEINHYLHTVNTQWRASDSPLLDHELTLKVPSLSLRNHRFGNHSLQIYDTPGPNEAGMGQVWQKVTPVIQTVDAIVYLLDYTKLKTIEEKAILEDLVAMRPDLLKNGCIFFVVNKIDRANRHSHAYEETARYVSTFLQQQLPELTITADQILLVAAEDALLARLVLNTRISAKARRDFLQRTFGQRETDETDEMNVDLLQSSASKLLQMSRIEELETVILTRLLARKEHVLCSEILYDLQKSLTQFIVDLQEIYKRLMIDQTNCKEKVSSLKEQIISTEQGCNKHLIADIKDIRRDVMSQSRRLLALEKRLSGVESLLEEVAFYHQDITSANVVDR